MRRDPPPASGERVVAQALSQLIPGLAGLERLGDAREDLDWHVRGHRQAIVRPVVFEARDPVAERIDVLAPELGCGSS